MPYTARNIGTTSHPRAYLLTVCVLIVLNPALVRDHLGLVSGVAEWWLLGRVVPIPQLHHHEYEEDLPGVVDLRQTGVYSVEATLELRLPDVKQRFGENLEVLHGESFRW